VVVSKSQGLIKVCSRRLQHLPNIIKDSFFLFPESLSEILKGYWVRELRGLIHPVPERGKVLNELRNHLELLIKPYRK
jgi:hypothetical protein